MTSKAKFDDINISDYTARSVAVQGDTRKYKEDLKKLGGKYNGQLKGGPGWIFPKTSEKDLVAFINGGKRLVTAEEAREGEERSKQRAKEWAEKDKKSPDRSSRGVSGVSGVSESVLTPTLGEMASLINMVKVLEKKMEAIMTIMTPEQLKTFNEYMKKKDVVKKVAKKVVKRKEETVVVINSDVDLDSDSDADEEEHKIPPKRLLRK